MGSLFVAETHLSDALLSNVRFLLLNLAVYKGSDRPRCVRYE